MPMLGIARLRSRLAAAFFARERMTWASRKPSSPALERAELAALHRLEARRDGGDGASRHAGHLPHRQYGARRSDPGAARRRRGLEQGLRRRMARQMGA